MLTSLIVYEKAEPKISKRALALPKGPAGGGWGEQRNGSERTRNQRVVKWPTARAQNQKPAPELLDAGHAPVTTRKMGAVIGDLASAGRSGAVPGAWRRSDLKKRAGLSGCGSNSAL